jgi:hypothetical protein
MKKNIFILAMVAMFVSANVMAQAPAKTETKKECCSKGEKKECKGDKKECKGEAKGACCDKKAAPAKK